MRSHIKSAIQELKDKIRILQKEFTDPNFTNDSIVNNSERRVNKNLGNDQVIQNGKQASANYLTHWTHADISTLSSSSS